MRRSALIRSPTGEGAVIRQLESNADARRTSGNRRSVPTQDVGVVLLLPAPSILFDGPDSPATGTRPPSSNSKELEVGGRDERMRELIVVILTAAGFRNTVLYG